MKRSKIFLASTAGLLAVVGIASAKMHKLFTTPKQCWFDSNVVGRYTVGALAFTQPNPNETASAAFTQYNHQAGAPCYSQSTSE